MAGSRLHRLETVQLSRSEPHVITSYSIHYTKLYDACQTAVPPLSFPSGAGEVLVKLSGLRNDQGAVVVSLFASTHGFPDSVPDSLATVTVPIRAGLAEARFTSVPYGEYALSVLHDEDGDGRMATGLFA